MTCFFSSILCKRQIWILGMRRGRNGDGGGIMVFPHFLHDELLWRIWRAARGARVFCPRRGRCCIHDQLRGDDDDEEEEWLAARIHGLTWDFCFHGKLIIQRQEHNELGEEYRAAGPVRLGQSSLSSRSSRQQRSTAILPPCPKMTHESICLTPHYRLASKMDIRPAYVGCNVSFSRHKSWCSESLLPESARAK